MTPRAASLAAGLLLLLAAAADTARAQIPNSAMPGREREQIFGKPGMQWGVPQIELQDGRPKPVFEVRPRQRPAKRRGNKCRSGQRC